MLRKRGRKKGGKKNRYIRLSPLIRKGREKKLSLRGKGEGKRGRPPIFISSKGGRFVDYDKDSVVGKRKGKEDQPVGGSLVRRRSVRLLTNQPGNRGKEGEEEGPY